MGKFLALSALLSVVATGFAQTYTVQNNCPGAIDLHVGNLPAESLASGATTVKTGLGPLAEFYTTTNGGIVDGRFVGAKAGFHLIPNFWAYYVGRDELDWFNTGITIIPNVPEHDGFCKVANCADAVNDGCTNGYPTLDQWSTPPGPDDGPIGAPIFQCKDANVDFTITFCPSGQWPNRPSQVIKPVADQSKCLDVRGAVFENGTPVQIYDCNGTAAQKWVIQDESSAPSKRIRLSGTNFCLDAGDNPAAPTGAKLKIWTCYSSLEQQRFNYIAAESRISITQPFKFAPSFCMDVTDGRFENANQVQMWDCANDNANQKWVAQ